MYTPNFASDRNLFKTVKCTQCRLSKSEPRIIGFMYNPHNEWKACRRRRQGPSNPIFSSGWSCGLAVLWSGGTPPFQHPPWAAAVAKLFFSQYTWHAVKHKGDHISYLSLPPRPAVVYFFQAGVLFCKENAKYWAIFAPYDQFRLFYAFFAGLNSVVVYQH